MEPRPRRRRSCRQLVSAFLRDPGSGRVYKRGKLIGKVGTRNPDFAASGLGWARRGPGGGAGCGGRGAVCVQLVRRGHARLGLCASLGSGVGLGAWSVVSRLEGVRCVGGTSIWPAMLCP